MSKVTIENARLLAKEIKAIEFESGRYKSHEAEFILARLPFCSRTARSLIGKFKAEIEKISGLKQISYSKGEYAASGSGAFGRYSNKRGRYNKPAIYWSRK